MSDSDGNKTTNGWHAPEQSFAWEPPDAGAAPKAKPATAPTIPTLPQNFSAVAVDEGGWHLPALAETTARPATVVPRPEDFGTTAPEEDKPIALRPEDMMPGGAESKPEEPAPKVLRPEDMLLDKEDDTEDAALDDLLEDSLEQLEEDEEDAFSMDALDALQTLADEEADAEEGSASIPVEDLDTQNQNYLADQLAALEGDVVDGTGNLEPTVEMVSGGELDPAAAAAAALAALEGGDTGAVPSAASGDDYMQQQLDSLGASPTDPLTAASPTSVIDPQQAELIEKFQQAETAIRALRQQRDMGMINQQQMEEQLRQYMVFDDREQVYWMMGADTDIWYKYVGNDWVVTNPPHLVNRQGVPTETGSLDPNQVIQGSLPYMPPDGGEVSGEMSGYTGNVFDSGGFTPATDFSGDYTPPDSQNTLVGAPAINQYDYLPGSEPTIENPAVSGYEPVDEAVSIESPFDDGEYAAPDYNLDARGQLSSEASERTRQNTMRNVLVGLGILVALGLLLIAIPIIFMLLQYNTISNTWAAEIATIQELSNLGQRVIFQDANGDEIYVLASQESGDRVLVDLDEVSPEMIFAIVAIENERFFVDPGFDPIAIARAFQQNYISGGVVSGASTITQQLARLKVINPSGAKQEELGLANNSALRKLHEIVIANQIASRFTKEQILELYLNELNFSNRRYGIESAAEFYFDKSASELNFAESAMLAGMVQLPAVYNPVVDPEATFGRMEVVLAQMVSVGCLPVPNAPSTPFCFTQEMLETTVSIQQAQVEIRVYLPEQNESLYPHFTEFVLGQLQGRYGISSDVMFQNGYIIRTTLNQRVQQSAENALRQQLAGVTLTGVNTGTVMVTDPRTGAIRAMVGSPDFNNVEIDGQVNIALTWQQPGSSIKPIVYAGALEGTVTDAGQSYYTPATILWDVPTNYPTGQRIDNFSGRYLGPISVRRALQNSINVAAVKAYQFIGNAKFQDIATRMGLSFLPEAQFGLPTALGATDVRLIDMMQAYGTMANDGVLMPLFAIQSITDADGNPVQLVPIEPRQAISPQLAYLMQSILSDDASRATAFGVNTSLTIPQYSGQVAAKTGTSNDSRDLWTLGFTDNTVVGVWMGRVDNAPTFNTTGYTVASPVWNAVMRAVLQATPPTGFAAPSGVVQTQVCAATGTQPGANCLNQRNEVFIDNQLPPPSTAGFVVTTVVDTWSGLLANGSCPGNEAERTFANISDPTAIAWLNSSAGQSTASQLGLTTPIQTLPTSSCDLNSPILQASFISPTNGAQLLEPQIAISGQIGAPNLQSYSIQVASAANPTNFTIVDGPFSTQSVNGTLGTWNAAQYDNGNYIIRLEMNSTSGGVAYRTINVTLNKPLPTPTQTPTFVPTIPPLIGTPIPLELSTPIPFGDSGGFPTATATVNFGG